MKPLDVFNAGFLTMKEKNVTMNDDDIELALLLETVGMSLRLSRPRVLTYVI